MPLRFAARPPLAALTLFSFALLGATLAVAAPSAPGPSTAPIKWIDANGRVHYSDRQPSPDQMRGVVRTQTVSAQPAAPSVGDPTLPWALRSAVARYPVTLYTSPECEPCQLARNHLAERGVPYTEKLVDDARDLQAFHALGFEKPLFPAVSIGREKLNGYESFGWDRALDATGYPRSSMLPARRDPRTIAPMRIEAAQRAADASAQRGATDAAQANAGEAAREDVDSLLSPASFRTGPNPIRF